MDTATFEQLSKRIDGYKDEMIEMQKKLISLPAVSPASGGKGEYQKGKYLEPFVRKVFDKVIECHAPYKDAEGGVRPNYACILNGKSKDKTVWIMAHMDVVPEGEGKLWNTPPFEAVVKDGKIYGRGSEDNNQAIVSGFFAAKAFKDEGVVPPCNIGLLLVSDEEIGSTYGARHVLEKHRDIFGKKDAIIIPDGGNAAGDDICISEKSRAWLKITTHGKQAHGAYPKNGLNAHRVAAHIIVKMDELAKIFTGKNSLFAPHDMCTFEPTLKTQNVQNINTIPGEDVIYYDCRIIPEVELGRFIAEFKKLAEETAEKFGARAEVTEEAVTQAAKPTSIDEDIVQSVVRASKRVYGVNGHPTGAGGNTVAQFFRKEGLPCVVYSRLDETLHGPNEYCIIDNMVGDAKVWCSAISDIK